MLESRHCASCGSDRGGGGGGRGVLWKTARSHCDNREKPRSVWLDTVVGISFT